LKKTHPRSFFTPKDFSLSRSDPDPNSERSPTFFRHCLGPKGPNLSHPRHAKSGKCHSLLSLSAKKKSLRTESLSANSLLNCTPAPKANSTASKPHGLKPPSLSEYLLSLDLLLTGLGPDLLCTFLNNCLTISVKLPRTSFFKDPTKIFYFSKIKYQISKQLKSKKKKKILTKNIFSNIIIKI
jgi:hypothetical protein